MTQRLCAVVTNSSLWCFQAPRSRRLRLRRVAPSRRNCSAAAAHAFGNSYKAAYYIPFTHPFVYSEAVRQSIHEQEDGYRDIQDYVDLLPRGVSLFLTW